MQNRGGSSVFDAAWWNWLLKLPLENKEVSRVQQVNCSSNETASAHPRHSWAWYCLNPGSRNPKQSVYWWDSERLGWGIDQKASRLSCRQAEKLSLGQGQQRSIFQRICFLRVCHLGRRVNGHANNQRYASFGPNAWYAWRDQNS
jgi:hypothetical protein